MASDDRTESAEIRAQELFSILPHRYPFILVDRVRELTEDKIVAIKNVTLGEPYFQGHFPGMPVMPGVLQVEAMAQTGIILASRSPEFDPDSQVFLFMGMDKVKFRKPVTPGDQLLIEVEPLRRGRIWRMKGTITVDGEVVSSAELTAATAPREGSAAA